MCWKICSMVIYRCFYSAFPPGRNSLPICWFRREFWSEAFKASHVYPRSFSWKSKWIHSLQWGMDQWLSQWLSQFLIHPGSLTVRPWKLTGPQKESNLSSNHDFAGCTQTTSDWCTFQAKASIIGCFVAGVKLISRMPALSHGRIS